MNLVLNIRPNCRQGEGNGLQNPENFVDLLYDWSLASFSIKSLEVIKFFIKIIFDWIDFRNQLFKVICFVF